MNEPQILSNRRFKNEVSKILVTLGQSPGLALKVYTKDENSVVIRPRFGYSIENRKDIEDLTWYEVHEDKKYSCGFDFKPMSEQEVKSFLDSIKTHG